MQQFDMFSPQRVAEPSVIEVPRHAWGKRPVSGLSDAELMSELCGMPEDSARSVLRSVGLAKACGLDRVTTPAHRSLALAAEMMRRAETEELLSRPGMGNPRDSGDFVRARLRHLPYEVFACLYLDNRHRVLAFEELFRGTIDGAHVPAREVVRACLQHNAAAVILAHNHPSGLAEPSAADRALTTRLRETLNLIDVRVLDHLVIGAGEPVSFASRGYL